MRHQPIPPTHGVSRRAMLQRAGLGAAGLSLLDALSLHEAFAAEAKKASAAPLAPLEPFNRFPRMVQEHFVGRVRAVEQLAGKRRAALKSKADAEAYVREVRAKIQQCFGPWPEKTPLNPRITGVVERDAYRIENVIFESRPNFPVTANLYVPKGRPFPLPGVVGSCGHSANGKAAEAYQSFAQGLARQGYVCLIFDPIGQGERLQYAGGDFKPRRGVGTSEHLYAGNQQFLVGEFLGAWRAWDGIRALDYLLTRPEVDAKHVGITGNSGGGTMTTWLCGVEPRWTMAAPSCFVTTFRRNMENELPADTEQCPPRALALGLDHADFIAALAPKPVVLLGKEKDFFDARGLEESHARLKRLYQLLGAEQNIRLFIGPTYHGYTQENREAMYECFNCATKISTVQKEPAMTIEKDETLWCTPHGQVAELKPRTVFSFTREISLALKQQRGTPGAKTLSVALREVLKLPETGGVPEYRILRSSTGRRWPKKFAATYMVETEPGIHALVYRLDDEALMSRPPRGAKRALLYVSHQSADAELREEPLLAELIKAEPDAAVFACDVRGTGESRPDTGNAKSFFSPYGSDYFYAIHSIMLDRPYAGQKTHDVLRVIAWLTAQGHGEIHLVSKGWGAIPATFAALLADAVVQVTLKNALTSYRDLAESEEYKWPLSSFVPGVLKKFDLPDCYAVLAAKKLKIIEPWGAVPAG
ncbi:MAG: prolyl oligopeptidase family serine peptidase [Verrucomicrobia bacterium]|nr:prolyl oligopeptidase family serine peptidase [Verrucomicrobiota bacterium]